MTGLRPIHLVRESVAGIRNGINSFREWRLHREMRRADIRGQLAISDVSWQNNAGRLKNNSRKKGRLSRTEFSSRQKELAGRPNRK